MTTSQISSPINLSGTENRVMELLASGVTVPQVAAAIGISESRIAQLLSNDLFASELGTRRFKALAKHNARDSEYDDIEDKLIKQLKDTLPMLMQPEKILRAIQVINAAKRRGTSSTGAITEKQTVIKLTLPIQVLNKFSTNASNQVVTVETGRKIQSMVTVQSGHMTTLVDKHKAERLATLLPVRESVPEGNITNEQFALLDQYGLDI